MSLLLSGRRRLAVRATVDALRAATIAAPSSPEGARILSLPARVGAELERRGLSRARLQEMAATRVNAETANTLELADGVLLFRLPYLAGVVGVSPAEVLDAVDATPIEAAAVGILPRDAAAKIRPVGPGGCPSVSTAAYGRKSRCGSDLGCATAEPYMRNPNAQEGCGLGELTDSSLDDIGYSDLVEAYKASQKPGAKLPADGWPSSPPFRPGNWSGAGGDSPTYVLASGDTLSGLARLYSGDPKKWDQIWALNKGTFPSADQLPAGATIAMPPAFGAAAVALSKGDTPAAPPSPGAPGAVPGADKMALGGKAGLSTGAKVGIAVGGAAAVSLLGYGLWRAAS